MSHVPQNYTLKNGVSIPSLGFGTWQVEDGQVAVDAVLHALKTGYRLIDTAQRYFNEGGVGTAIQKSGVRRGELFLTSKLRNTTRGYEATLAALEESLQKLGTDYLDLFLLHWPVPFDFKDNWAQMNADSWGAMEDALKAGKIRALGISNFRRKHIDALLEGARELPQVNQLRLCPADRQEETASYSREKGMLLQAYSPLGTGKLLEVRELKEIAEKQGRSVAQVAIRWGLQRGYNPLPKSITKERIEENFRVFDFELDEGDMAVITALEGIAGYSYDPDHITW